MRWTDLPIMAFDTETTGLDPFSGDRVIEIAVVELRIDEAMRVVSRTDHAWLVNPGIPLSRPITQITGIRDDDLVGRPEFALIASDVAALLSGGVAVAHNLPFDHAFLTTEFRRAQVDWREPLVSVDTVDLAMRVDPDARGFKLGDVAKRYGVDLVEAHRAANDAAACGLAFLEMARRAGVPDDLDALVAWAGAIGPPPADGPIGRDAAGLPVFREGPHAGQPVGDHPLHLAWMEKARARRPADPSTGDRGGWDWRFSEATRVWARRWLDVRTTGRAPGSPKSFRAEDWVIDPCITDDRKRGLVG
jgi:DNA polymerase-3 subunit epsilon